MRKSTLTSMECRIRSFPLLLILFFAPLSLNAESVLLITSGRGEPFVNAENTGFYDLVVKNMFSRVGVKAKTVLLPSERALINANSGVDDGNIARIKGIEKKYSRLVMVPEKIIDFDFVVFTKKDGIKATSWKSLEPYNVAFINGWKFFEKRVTHYKSLVRTRDSSQLFGLLDHDRVDIILYDMWSGLWKLKQLQTKNIHHLRPPIARVELYMYINNKHRDMVPALAKALKMMKRDGTYKLIYDQSLKSLLE